MSGGAELHRHILFPAKDVLVEVERRPGSSNAYFDAIFAGARERPTA